MTNIVVGFDGTEASFVALDWAAERAARGATRVEIVMIAGTILSDDFRIDASIVNAERRLRDRAPDVEVSSRCVPGGMPESLVEQASAADLLVVGSHRGRRLRQALSGRMPLRIASRSGVPVVVVPDDWSPAAGPVVVGLDDDDSSRAAIAIAAQEADAGGVPLMVVHAWEMPTPRMEGSVALLASPIQAKAEHRMLLRAASVSVTLAHPTLGIEQVLVQGSPTAVLVQSGRDASLLVVGTHHRGLLAGALHGSVVQGLLSQSAVPVCIAPNTMHQGHLS